VWSRRERHVAYEQALQRAARIIICHAHARRNERPTSRDARPFSEARDRCDDELPSHHRRRTTMKKPSLAPPTSLEIFFGEV
jgi:hypothetical protein